MIPFETEFLDLSATLNSYTNLPKGFIGGMGTSSWTRASFVQTVRQLYYNSRLKWDLRRAD